MTKDIRETLDQREETTCVYKATTKKGETAHFGEYSQAAAWAGWGSVEAIPLKTLTLISKSIKPCTTCDALARTVMLDQTSHDTKREWVGLTDEEIDEAVNSCRTTDTRKYFRAIEAKLKEKNHD
jgi:hypothetical protein